ncbi:metal-dependent protein hydrolase, partial [Kipferlia bialata]
VGLYNPCRGKSAEDIEAELGFPGITFVHNSGFLGQGNTLEAGLRLCMVSLGLTDSAPLMQWLETYEAGRVERERERDAAGVAAATSSE